MRLWAAGKEFEVEIQDANASTKAVTVLAPFRSWLSRALAWAGLLRESGREHEVRSLGMFRHAYFVRLSPRQFKRIGVPVDGALKHGALLFVGAVNGRVEEGFTPAFAHFRRYVERGRRPLFEFASEPFGARAVARDALAVREALEEVLEIARSGASDEEFGHAYRRLTRIAREARA